MAGRCRNQPRPLGPGACVARRPPRANRGVFLRTSDLGDPVDTGIEVQIANSYGVQGTSRSGTAGAIYDGLAPSKNAIRKPGD